jgi:putative transposase
VPEIWRRFRETAAKAATPTWGHLASGRGVHSHQRRAALSLARRSTSTEWCSIFSCRIAGTLTAAKRFFKRLLQGLKYKPRRLITDGLRSYGVAHREILPDVRHRTSRYLNNRAENSHRPTRRRERQMQRFKSSDQAQRFLAAHGMIYGHFRPRRHLLAADAYRRARAKAFRIWKQETYARIAA